MSGRIMVGGGSVLVCRYSFRPCLVAGWLGGWAGGGFSQTSDEGGYILCSVIRRWDVAGSSRSMWTVAERAVDRWVDRWVA